MEPTTGAGDAMVVEEVLRLHRQEMVHLLNDWLSKLDFSLAGCYTPSGMRSPSPYGPRLKSHSKPSKASTRAGLRLEDELSDPESASAFDSGIMSPKLPEDVRFSPKDESIGEEVSEDDEPPRTRSTARMDSTLSYEEAKMTDEEISRAWHMGLGSGALKGKRTSLTLGWWHKFRWHVANLVNSQWSTAFWTMAILTNSIYLGIHLQWSTTTRDIGPNAAFDAVHAAYAILFTVEVVLRLIAFGLYDYICNKDWKWNWLDLFVVVTSWIEIIADQMTSGSVRGTNTNLRIIRILRLGRLVRVVRIVRVVRLFRALRTLVASLMGTLKSLFWSFLLLFLVIYIFGILFTDIALDHAVEYDLTDESLMVVPGMHRVQTVDAFRSLKHSTAVRANLFSRFILATCTSP